MIVMIMIIIYRFELFELEFLNLAVRVCPLAETRQTVPCRAIRGSSISGNDECEVPYGDSAAISPTVISGKPLLGLKISCQRGEIQGRV